MWDLLLQKSYCELSQESMDNVMDTGLISRALNYHGIQLKKAWEAERGESDLDKLNVENVDYTIFQERQKNIR